MSGTEQPVFCSYRPVPGEFLTAACVECGHALVLHIGVEHCPVCELAHLNQQARAALESTSPAALENAVRQVLERDRAYYQYSRL